MPLMYKPIPEITTHILDPIVEQLIFRILKRCNLIDVFKESIFIKPGYTAVSETNDLDNKTLLYRNMFKCDVAYNMNPLNTKWTVASQEHLTHYGISPIINNRRYPILYDPHTQIRMYEIGNPKSMLLSCSMTFTDREIAYSTIETLTSIYGNGDEIYSTNFYFDFPLPQEILFVLFYLYKEQNLKLSFKEYVEIYADSNYGSFSTLKSRENHNQELVIQRNNVYTIYQIEFQDEKPSEDSNNQSTSSYTVPFQLTTQFNCPSKIFLQYPVMINNKEVSAHFIPLGYSEFPRAADGKFTQDAIENLRPSIHNYININQYGKDPLIIPFYDDWRIPIRSPLYKAGFTPFLIITFTLDNEEQTLLEITKPLDPEVGIALRPEVIKILQFQKEYSFTLHSLINVSIFSNNHLLDPNHSKLLDNGDIETYCRLRFRVHHLVLSFARNENKLTRELNWVEVFKNKEYDKFFEDALGPIPEIQEFKPLIPTEEEKEEEKPTEPDDTQPPTPPDDGEPDPPVLGVETSKEEVPITEKTAGEEWAHGTFTYNRFFILRTFHADIIPTRATKSTRSQQILSHYINSLNNRR
jgi:hypothetical protein